MRRLLGWISFGFILLCFLNLVSFLDHSNGNWSQVSFRLNGAIYAVLALGGLLTIPFTAKPAFTMAIVVILSLGSITSFAASGGSFQATASFSNLAIGIGILAFAIKARANHSPIRT